MLSLFRGALFEELIKRNFEHIGKDVAKIHSGKMHLLYGSGPPSQRSAITKILTLTLISVGSIVTVEESIDFDRF